MLRALAKDPDARFQTALDYAGALMIATGVWGPRSGETRRELASMIPRRPARLWPTPDGVDTISLVELLERTRTSLPSLPAAAVPVYAPAAARRRRWLLVLAIGLLGVLAGIAIVLAAHPG